MGAVEIGASPSGFAGWPTAVDTWLKLAAVAIVEFIEANSPCGDIGLLLVVLACFDFGYGESR